MKSQVLHHVEVEVDLLEVNQVTAMGLAKPSCSDFGHQPKTLYSKTVGQSGVTPI